MCSPCSLTEEQIDGLNDEGDALDLLEEHGINQDGVADIAEAKKRLRNHLKNEIKKTFKCLNCDLSDDDLDHLTSISQARTLMIQHRIPSENVTSVDKAHDLLRCHLRDKMRLEPYNIEEVAVIVRKLVEEHNQGRIHLLSKFQEVKDYIARMPPDRMANLRQQIPSLEEDLEIIYEQLEKESCTLMVAGETGAGKSCLLNLLLGELTSELLAVNNLPATSALCEIKYGKEACIKAYPVDNGIPETRKLTSENASDIIAQYTTKQGERTELQYKKVEVYWPCEWIKHGITITDTPGVGESEELTNMVKDYIPKASGFIYVLNTTNAGGINPEELEDLLLYHINREGLSDDPDLPLGKAQQIIKFDPQSAIFVCNKWDQVKIEEIDEVKNYVKSKLQKVWKGFDFESQVFFISAKEITEELQSGYVTSEYRRLLSGIQNLLPVGFRSKMESQFWKMYNIMDRSTWILKHYVLCGDQLERDDKKDRYNNAKEKLKQLEGKPVKAKQDMQQVLDEEVDTAMLCIRSYMETKEVQDRLFNWKETDCPMNDNYNRLQQLQWAYAEKRIRTEIYTFEENQNLFAQIQQKVLEKFKSIFVSVENELDLIESDMNDELEVQSLLSTLFSGGTEFAFKFARNHHSFMAESGSSNTIFGKLATVINTFALPVITYKRHRAKQQEERRMSQYQQNKPVVMAQITKEVVNDLVHSKKIRSVVEEKLRLLQIKFDMLLQRIPCMIDANKRMISELEKQLEMGTDFNEYIDHFNDGLNLQNDLNYDYMIYVRTFDINMTDIHDLVPIGEGSFAKVYKGVYQKRGITKIVAVKRYKESLSSNNVSDFVSEELNLKRIQSPHIVSYIGTGVKRSHTLLFPAMVQEYCEQTLDQIIYEKSKYTGPGQLEDTNKTRPTSLKRAAKFADEISLGLSAMHKQGFLHRDLKPENILVSMQEGNTEVVKLCDLGISKRERDLTKSLVGTPLYMAPEVANREKYDRTADMFSYGLIVWEIWYGARIETRYNIDNYQTFCKTAFNSKKGHVPPIEWQEILARCWSIDTKQRPQASECSRLFSQMY